MPSGSIPHGQERPTTNKRHAKKTTDATKKTKFSDAVENLSEDDVLYQMRATLQDILVLTRRYMRLHKHYAQISGQRPQTFGAQFSVLWIVNRAHWAGDVQDIERLHEEMEQEPML